MAGIPGQGKHSRRVLAALKLGPARAGDLADLLDLPAHNIRTLLHNLERNKGTVRRAKAADIGMRAGVYWLLTPDRPRARADQSKP